jgi:hypothetical protein
VKSTAHVVCGERIQVESMQNDSILSPIVLQHHARFSISRGPPCLYVKLIATSTPCRRPMQDILHQALLTKSLAESASASLINSPNNTGKFGGHHSPIALSHGAREMHILSFHTPSRDSSWPLTIICGRLCIKIRPRGSRARSR